MRAIRERPTKAGGCINTEPLCTRNMLKHFFILTALFLAGCATTKGQPELTPFTSDGCTLFPDKSLISQTDWCDCCIAHDIAYWKGGTREERLKADEALRSCVQAKTGNEGLANLMFEGVRIGGSPHFQNWYHWGYGWEHQFEYRELSIAEKAYALLLLTDFQSSDYESVCPSTATKASIESIEAQ